MKIGFYSKGCWILLLLITTLSMFPVSGEETSEEVSPPKIALVLQGGGALGIAHIAVMNHTGNPGDCFI